MVNIAYVCPPRSGGTTECILTATDLSRNILYLNTEHVPIQHAVTVHVSKVKDWRVFHLAGTELDEDVNRRIRNIHYTIEDAISEYWTPADLDENQSNNKFFGYKKNLVVEQFKTVGDSLHERDKNSINTVPHIALRMPNNMRKQIDTLIIDEDRTISSFKPKSTSIFTYTKERGYRFTKDLNIKHLTKNCPEKLAEKYPEYIEWAREVKEINGTFESLSKQLRDEGVQHPEKEALDRIASRLPEPPHLDEPIEKRIKIAEQIKKQIYKTEEEYKAVEIIIAALFFEGYKPKTFRGGGRIDIIAKEDVLLFGDWLNSFDNIIVRVNDESKAAWLFTKLNREYELFKEEEFRYRWNFTLFRTKALKYTESLARRGIPCLHVTARRKKAEELKQEFESKGISCELVGRNTSLNIIRDWINTGKQIITYLNSSISRAIDLPQLDICVVWEVYFSAPYHEWLSDSENIEGEDPYEHKVKSELTQTVLRISPIKGVNKDQPKFVVFDNKLFGRGMRRPRLRYIESDIIEYPAEKLAEITEFFSVKRKKTISKLNKPELERLGEIANQFYYNILYESQISEGNNPLINKLLTLVEGDNEKKNILLSMEGEKLIKIQDLYKQLVHKEWRQIKELVSYIRELGFRNAFFVNYFISFLKKAGLLIKDKETKVYRVIPIREIEEIELSPEETLHLKVNMELYKFRAFESDALIF